jgi:PAT family beta-lactamase induction signal transducer AmpG
MAVTQVALAVVSLGFAGVGSHPDAIWVVGALALAIALASASQDIAIDAYAVEVLRPEEQGPAVGARTALYRAGLVISGGAAITGASYLGWPTVNLILALMYLPMLIITWQAPEPEEKTPAPTTLRDAVWHPFLGFLARHRALEILGFVLLYKLSDQLTQALTRPFLIDMGYSADHRGIALATVGLVATVVGAVVGAWMTTLMGLGHSLWVFGFLQVFSNLGYYFVALAGGPVLPLMYGATSFELFTSGLGTGAFSVLLVRMTQKRFSATQFALFSSLFALPRLLAGPIAGVSVDAMGWPTFFLSTLVMGVPGLVMLHRFVPIGTRDPVFTVDEVPHGPELGRARIAWRGVAGGVLIGAAGFFLDALLLAVKTMREPKSAGFDFAAAVGKLGSPAAVTDWVELGGIIAFGVIGGLFVAALTAARRGEGRRLAADQAAGPGGLL